MTIGYCFLGFFVMMIIIIVTAIIKITRSIVSPFCVASTLFFLLYCCSVWYVVLEKNRKRARLVVVGSSLNVLFSVGTLLVVENCFPNKEWDQDNP